MEKIARRRCGLAMKMAAPLRTAELRQYEWNKQIGGKSGAAPDPGYDERAACLPVLCLFSGAGITATAKDADGNTSEFSSCIPYQDDAIFANGFDS